MFEGYSNFKNKLQEEKVESKDQYSWLESDDPKTKMTDKFLKVQLNQVSPACQKKNRKKFVVLTLVC